jgi:hypothetical protein
VAFGARLPAAREAAAAADHPTSCGRSCRPNPDDESFGILMFCGVRFARIRRVQEESSAPQSRLACNHLQISFVNYRSQKKE